jgi:hypothetical protein
MNYIVGDDCVVVGVLEKLARRSVLSGLVLQSVQAGCGGLSSGT